MLFSQNFSEQSFSEQSFSEQIITLAQASPKPAATPPKNGNLMTTIWMSSSLVLLVAVLGLLAYGKFKIYEPLKKELKLEKYKAQDLQKRLKLALKTIQKMESNPDLIHSREFNLDYLRLRMDEEIFHYTIVNQIKIRVKQLISVALRPNTATQQVGIANTSGRQIDETFDVTYETENQGKRVKRILFRIQVKLIKLPTQSTSSTISQIIDCIEKFLSPHEDHDTWQPMIQSRLVKMDWDQKAKPTPLLVLEQSSQGGNNVTIRSNANRRLINDSSSEDGSIAKVGKQKTRKSSSKSSSKGRSSSTSKTKRSSSIKG